MKDHSDTDHCNMSERGSLLIRFADTFIPSLGLHLNRLARRLMNGVLRPYDRLWLGRAYRDALGCSKLTMELFRRKVAGRPEAILWAHRKLFSAPVVLVILVIAEPVNNGEVLLRRQPTPKPLTSAPNPIRKEASPTISKGPAPSGNGPTSLSFKPPLGWGTTQAGGAPDTADEPSRGLRPLPEQHEAGQQRDTHSPATHGVNK